MFSDRNPGVLQPVYFNQDFLQSKVPVSHKKWKVDWRDLIQNQLCPIRYSIFDLSRRESRCLVNLDQPNWIQERHLCQFCDKFISTSLVALSNKSWWLPSRSDCVSLLTIVVYWQYRGLDNNMVLTTIEYCVILWYGRCPSFSYGFTRA